MHSDIYWIEFDTPGRLGISARPRSGDWLESEINGWKAAGASTVVCLLEPTESHELGLQTEASVCAQEGIEFLECPIPDRGVPESAAVIKGLVEVIESRLAAGKAIIIHCRAGIGRSSLIAACVLVKCGIRNDLAFERIARARRLPVPDTLEQQDWVRSFEDVIARGVA
jgi:protein-tyrosine phosphatase